MSWVITPGQPVPIDPYRSQVSLLLHGDGANNSTTIVDTSPTPKAVQVFGDAKISTAQSKFGGSSLVFDGSVDKLTAGTSQEFDLSSGDFTVECWLYVSSAPASNQVIVAKWGNTVVTGWRLEIDSSVIAWYTNTTRKLTSAYVAQQWNHVAVAKSGSNSFMYINGVLASGPASDSFSASDLTKPLTVGALDYPGFFQGFVGYIDDLRITKGIARYTSNFTPPTAPFPDI